MSLGVLGYFPDTLSSPLESKSMATCVLKKPGFLEMIIDFSHFHLANSNHLAEFENNKMILYVLQ